MANEQRRIEEKPRARAQGNHPPANAPDHDRRGCWWAASIGCFVTLILAAVAFSVLASMCSGILNDPSVTGRPPSFFSTTVPTRSGTAHTAPTTATTAPTTTTNCPSGAVGALEAATGVPGGIRATGWARVCGTAGAAQVYANLDDRRVAGPFPANKSRPDLENPHGFDFTIPASPGTHSVCAVVSYDGNEHLVGCTTVTVP